MITKHQKFQAITIHRREIKNAPYNPRTITPARRQTLKNNLRRRGLLETLVWNSVTGNLVSGHQRLSILDELEGSDDYSLTVASVVLTDQEEKEQNIFFNSQSAQGQFDEGRMKILIPQINAEFAGLDKFDLGVFGIETPKVKAQAEPKEQPPQKSYEERKAAIQATKKEVIEQAAESDLGDAYINLSFNSYAAKSAFLKRFGYMESLRFLKGEEFSAKIASAD